VILQHLPKSVRLVEVGPRDGLQNEAEPLSVEAKVALIDLLSEAGCPEIEVAAFVSPRRVPQMAGAEEVARRIQRRPGLVYSALVPNEEGLERALTCSLDRIAVFTAASETFNLRNVHASIDESIKRFRPVVSGAKQAGLGVRGYISTAFVCPFEGPIPAETVVPVAERLLELGLQEISFGDTIGAAVPSQIDRLLDHLAPVLPIEQTAMHLHDTRGTALANVLLALQRGVGIFDSSVGGLGGCPFAPGAAGNLATEEILYFLGQMGIETGVDGAILRRASDFLEGALGRPLSSKVRSAGP
jgi:hydroxymethylglutaryl-CoA lyase